MYRFQQDGNGSFFFREEGGALSGTTLGDVFDDFDGSRRGRIRYDSPNLLSASGQDLTLGVAAGQNILSSSDDDTYYEFCAYCEGDFNGTAVGAGIAYKYCDRDDSSRDDVTGWVMSPGILTPSGFGAAIGHGTEDDGSTDPSWWYVQATHDADFLDTGTTGLGIDYLSGSGYAVETSGGRHKRQ